MAGKLRRVVMLGLALGLAVLGWTSELSAQDALVRDASAVDPVQTNGTAPSRDAGAEEVTISQINYADTDDEYFTIRIKKKLLLGLTLGAALVLAAAFGLTWAAGSGKKRNPELQALYRQLRASNEPNEIYNLFNAIIKYRYSLSIKGSSKDLLRRKLPDGDLALRITELMDYMESGAEKDQIWLKKKISGIL